MILIIAEKPSLARNIAAAIGTMQKRNGYLEGEGYLVTWAFGHLFSLCDIETYAPQENGSTRWTMSNLPCFPKKFQFELRRGSDKKVDSGVVRQFEVIRSLCNRPDVDTVVNAGDADREGEIIVRLCVEHALQSPKSLKRLWLPDQTAQTVAKALGEMKDETEYDRLASEGLARTYIDWLYGVNLTRYATLRSGTLLRVGRVIVPIVQAIYDRDMAIKNFVPEKYAVEARNEGKNIHKYLREKAQKLAIGESGILVLDWFNGNRSVLADYDLSGMMLGLTLASRPEEIYRAIIEATAFGARMIVEAFEDGGVPVNSIYASGGIALKDEMMMQIFADVTGKEVRVASTTQAGALGSAIYASVAAGIYTDMSPAVEVISKPAARVYTPVTENSIAYEPLFNEYKTLHDYFGRGGNDVMKRIMKK